MMQPIRPVLIHPEATDLSKWKGHRLWFVDPEQKYILRLASYVVELFHVNTDHVKPAELKSVQELLNPKWKGKISAFDPTVPGTGSNTAAKFYFQLGENFVKRLYIEQLPVISRDRRQMTDWLARGTHPIALNPADVEGMQKDGFPIKGIYGLPDMPGAVSGGFGLVVFLENAPNPNAARLFINWMASREGVETYSRAVGHTSLRNDVDESFLLQDKIPRPGIKYFDSYDWQFTATGEEKVRIWTKMLLQR
jgi:iron(III) transport system substrate-binding protein